MLEIEKRLSEYTAVLKSKQAAIAGKGRGVVRESDEWVPAFTP